MATKKGKVRRFVYEYDPETEKDSVTVEFVGVFGTFTEEEYDAINARGTGGEPMKALHGYINGASYNWTEPPAKQAPNLEDLRIADMSEAEINAFLKAL